MTRIEGIDRLGQRLWWCPNQRRWQGRAVCAGADQFPMACHPGHGMKQIQLVDMAGNSIVEDKCLED